MTLEGKVHLNGDDGLSVRPYPSRFTASGPELYSSTQSGWSPSSSAMERVLELSISLRKRSARA